MTLVDKITVTPNYSTNHTRCSQFLLLYIVELMYNFITILQLHKYSLLNIYLLLGGGGSLELYRCFDKIKTVKTGKHFYKLFLL